MLPKISADMKKNLTGSLSTTEFLKTKIKPHGNEVTSFYDKKCEL